MNSLTAPFPPPVPKSFGAYLEEGGGIVWESDLSWRNERFFDISVQKKAKNVRLLKLKETKRAFTVV